MSVTCWKVDVVAPGGQFTPFERHGCTPPIVVPAGNWAIPVTNKLVDVTVVPLAVANVIPCKEAVPVTVKLDTFNPPYAEIKYVLIAPFLVTSCKVSPANVEETAEIATSRPLKTP